MTPQEINLNLLRNRFAERFNLKKILSAVRSPRRKRLARLLRDNREEGFGSQSEIDFREEVDFLLEYLSRFEVATYARVIPSQPDRNVSRIAMEVLGDDIVQRYYQVYYPQLLPELFLRRVTTGKGPLIARKHLRLASAAYAEFLWLDGQFNDGDEIESFLWLLEDGSWGGRDIDDLGKLVASKNRFWKSLSKPDEECDRLDDALRGLRKFIQSAHALHGLLQRCQPDAGLRERIWNYFSYWFVRLADQQRRYVPKFLAGVRRWALHDLPRERRSHAAMEFTHMEESILELLDGPSSVKAG